MREPTRVRRLFAVLLLPVVVGPLLFGGCSRQSTGNLEQSSLDQEFDFLSQRILLLGANSAADTFRVAAYPVRHFETEGQNYTLMAVGKPYYVPSVSGSGGGGGIPSTSTTRASVGISRKSPQAYFAIASRLPLGKKHHWLILTKFAPALFYFPAACAGDQVTVDGTVVPVLVPASGNTPRDVKTDHDLSGPEIPDHLKAIWQPPFMAVRDYYILGEYADVPRLFPLDLDAGSTDRLMQEVVEGTATAIPGFTPAAARRVSQWLEARGSSVASDAYRSGRRSGTYLGIDRRGAVRLQQLHSARRSAERAQLIDPDWTYPPSQIDEIDRAIEALDPTIEEPVPAHWFNRLRLSMALEIFNSSGEKAAHELEARNFGILGPELSFQLTNSVAATLAWHPFQTYDPRLPVDSSGETRTDTYGLRLDYQVPLRLQVSKFGLRPQLCVGWRTLAVTADVLDDKFTSRGSAFEVGFGLITRQVCTFSGRDWGLSLTACWRSGSYDNFQNDEGATLIHVPSLLPLTMRADGVGIRFGMGFGY